MESYRKNKYLHLIKLFNKNNHLEILAIDQIPSIFNIIKKNLIQKKSIKFKNTYKGF